MRTTQPVLEFSHLTHEPQNIFTMIKRIFTLLLATFLLPLACSAQNSDQVTLKNGSVIRGTVKKLVPDGNVTIDDMAGNTWVFRMDEVEQIEAIEGGTKHISGNLNPGLVNMTTIGFLAGSQNSEYIAPFSMQTSVGYMTSSGIYGGVLTGIEFLNINHIPLMIDFQYALKTGDVIPVLIARGGYMLPSKSTSDYYGTKYTYSGGPAGALGMGLKIRSRENFAWDVSLLYRYMQINYTEDYEWQDNLNKYRDVYNRLELRVGFYIGM